MKKQQNKPIYKKKLGLALGSGSFRGFAHIGTIKALEEENIPISYLAGTSVGAMVATFYAFGILEKLEDYVINANWRKALSMLDLGIGRGGLIDGRKITKELEFFLPKKNIEDSYIPVSIVATNAANGEKLILKSGRASKLIRASISLPGIFTPVKWKNTYLLDGGIVDPVPVDVVREMGADVVLAVNVNADLINNDKLKKHVDQKFSKVKISKLPDTSRRIRFFKIFGKDYNNFYLNFQKWRLKSKRPNIFSVISNLIHTWVNQVTEQNLKIHKPDILITPQLGHLGMFEFTKSEYSIEEGYNQTKKIIPELKKLLNKVN